MNATIKLDTRRATSKGDFPLVLAVKNTSYIRINTGICCAEKDWDGMKLKKSYPNCAMYNSMLSKWLSDVNLKLFPLVIGQYDNAHIADMVREILHPNTKLKGDRTFISYIEEYIATKQNKGTIAGYNTTINKIRAYQELMHRVYSLEDINYKWLVAFDAWMANTMSVNGRSPRMRDIRTVINYCIACEYTEKYPFKRFKIKQEETVHRALTIEQLTKLKHAEKEPWMQKYWDIFMLEMYMCGISPIDLLLAKNVQVKEGRLIFKRQKLGYKGFIVSLAIPCKAQEIIDRYKGNEYILDVMETYKDHHDFLKRMRNALSKIGTDAHAGKHPDGDGIVPELTAYWSRHTYATIAHHIGIDTFTIDRSMGHKVDSVIDIYIANDNSKIDEAQQKFIDFIESL